MSQPFEAAGTFRGIISERESELETLKAQLAQLKAIINQELASYEQFSRLCARQMQNDDAFRYRTVATVLRAILERDETALRSAPPSAPTSALTADVAQSMPDRSPSRGVTGKEHLATNQEVAALGKQPSAVSAECDYRTRYGEKCTLSNGHEGGHGHIVRTAFPKATQTFLDKTNAGEERQDLARQSSPNATPTDEDYKHAVYEDSAASDARSRPDTTSGFQTASTQSGPQDPPSRSEWISVETKLPGPSKVNPNHSIRVRFYAPDGRAYEEGYEFQHGIYWFAEQYWSGDRQNLPCKEVTHWQPLPSAPPSPAREKEKAE